MGRVFLFHAGIFFMWPLHCPLPFYSRTLTSSIPAKAGISLFAEAGRATLAPLRVVICADGAGIGRFPLSREWKGGAGMEGFFYSALVFVTPHSTLPFSRRTESRKVLSQRHPLRRETAIRGWRKSPETRALRRSGGRICGRSASHEAPREFPPHRKATTKDAQAHHQK